MLEWLFYFLIFVNTNSLNHESDNELLSAWPEAYNPLP